MEKLLVVNLEGGGRGVYYIISKFPPVDII
jgi:hypothetical protein